MGKVAIDMSMRLHTWGFDNPGVFERVFDKIRIHLVNVLLGGGRRMFDVLPERIELKQTGLYEAGGVAHLEYRVVR